MKLSKSVTATKTLSTDLKNKKYVTLLQNLLHLKTIYRYLIYYTCNRCNRFFSLACGCVFNVEGVLKLSVTKRISEKKPETTGLKKCNIFAVTKSVTLAGDQPYFVTRKRRRFFITSFMEEYSTWV